MLTLPVPNELNNVQSINSARLLYTSCINETALALEAESALLNFVDNELGGWPILQGSSWNESSFDLANLMYKLREYNQNIVFGFSTSTDEKNSSAYFI
ncbi:unnamed protein product, partial [Rotaria magnacalcarata]